MKFIFEPISIPVIISMIITILLGSMAYVRRRDNPLAELFSGLMFAVTLWSFCYFMSLSSPTIEGKYLWLRLKYIGSASAPFLWLDFSLKFTQHKKIVEKRWVRILLFLFPIVICFAALTNSNHNLFWSEVWIEPGFPEEFVTHGIGFYIYFLLSYLIVLSSFILYLIYFIRAISLYKGQALTMLLGSLFPLLASASYAFFDIDLFPKLDETIIAFLISGIFFSVSLFRFRALDVIPIANQLILRRLKEGIIVLNHENTIIEMNPSAARIFGLDAESTYGKNISQVMEKWQALFISSDGETNFDSEIAISINNEQLHFLVNKSPILDNRNRLIGNIFLITDITRRKATEIQLHHMATHDSLTQVYNRRHYFSLAEREIARAKRYNHSLGYMICDLDRFKRINDTYGHLVGDEVLKKFTELCFRNLRKSDVFARFGGEEFSFLFPEISVNDLVTTGEKIRQIVEEASIIVEDHEINLTVSIGLYHCSEPKEMNLVECLKRADQALYRSKQEGRNKSSLWDHKLDLGGFINTPSK